MDAKRLGIGTLVGAVIVLTTSYIIFTIPPFSDFYAYAMNAGAATGVERQPPLLWPVALGALSYSALVTLAIGTRGSSSSVGAGIKIGALVGFLLWFTANFMFYGISNVGNLASTVVDSLIEPVPGAVAGGIIAAVLQRIR